MCKWLVRAEVLSGQKFLVLAFSPLVMEEGTVTIVYGHPTHTTVRKLGGVLLVFFPMTVYFLLSFKYSVFF